MKPSLRTCLFSAACTLAASPAWAAAEAHGHDEGIPKSLIFAGINFAILVAALVYFLKKPAKEFFASRSTLIRTTLEQTKALKDNAEKKYAEYEKRLKDIDREMKAMIDGLKHDGELEKQRLVANAKRQVENLRDTQQKVLSQEMRKAKEELKQEAINLASEMAEKLIRDNLNQDDQSRLVDQYLEKMEKLA